LPKFEKVRQCDGFTTIISAKLSVLMGAMAIIGAITVTTTAFAQNGES
jgi:hypothetical protein